MDDSTADNTTHSTFSLPNSDFESMPSTITAEEVVKISRTCYIKPNSMRRIDVFVNSTYSGDILILPRRELERSKHVAIGKTIITL